MDVSVGMTADRPFYTIGHSNRTLVDFVALLREAGVAMLVDVRTVPRSRYNPQFNTDSLPAALAEHRIGYRHLPSLGGRRPQTHAPSPNDFWEAGGFRSFADYAHTAEFRTGLAGLLSLQEAHSCAIMCAEAKWWQCHRRIITDYLLAAGGTVRHIVGMGDIQDAVMTPQARNGPDGTLVYPTQAPLLL